MNLSQGQASLLSIPQSVSGQSSDNRRICIKTSEKVWYIALKLQFSLQVLPHNALAGA